MNDDLDPWNEPTPWRFEDHGVISELGVIRESVLNQSNDFIIWGEARDLTRGERFACWLNGWLPFGIRVTIDRRLIRL